MRLALYQPDIAQNVGTTLRSCACFGVDVDIIEPCGFPFDDRKFRRAGMDYIDHVHYQRHVSWDVFFQWCQDKQKRLILLSSKATQSYTDFRYQKGDILMVGRETAGVPNEVGQACHNQVTIPMQPEMRSLNVAIAAAVVLSESLRQTSLSSKG